MIAQIGMKPTRERRRRGDVVRAAQQIADAGGNIGRPYIVRDVVAAMERRGAITPEMRAAADEFRALFRRACLDPLRCARLDRVIGAASPGAPLSVERARHDVWQRLQQVGGIASPAGSCLWHVVGSEQSLRQWALTQGWAGRLVSQEAASGILIAALGTLAGERAGRGAFPVRRPPACPAGMDRTS